MSRTDELITILIVFSDLHARRFPHVASSSGLEMQPPAKNVIFRGYFQLLDLLYYLLIRSVSHSVTFCLCLSCWLTFLGGWKRRISWQVQLKIQQRQLIDDKFKKRGWKLMQRAVYIQSHYLNLVICCVVIGRNVYLQGLLSVSNIFLQILNEYVSI